jgi:hypothetical protein
MKLQTRICRLLVVIFSIYLISSCTSYEILDVKKFNKEISERDDIKSPEELILLFYDYPESELTNKLKISAKKNHENEYTIILIHDGMDDDSQKALKYIMKANFINNKWEVFEVRISRKCWSGRGHKNWSRKWCS